MRDLSAGADGITIRGGQINRIISAKRRTGKSGYFVALVVVVSATMEERKMRDLGQIIGAQAGPEAGVVNVPGVGEVRLVDWREDIIYDSVELPTAITAGAEYVFFRDVQDKNLLETNMGQSSRLPADWEAIIWKMGIYIPTDEAFADINIVLNQGYTEFKVGQVIVVRQGPVFTLPSGFGGAGFSALDAQAAAAERTILTNGTPGPGAVPPMGVPIHITPDLTFQGLLKFFTAQTLSAATTVYMVLSGWLKRPVR